MSRGRPPKPTATHRAKGTYRADRHGSRMPEGVSAIPSCPDHLTDRYRQAWTVIVDQAKTIDGLVTLADATALETAAVALVRYWQVREAIDALVTGEDEQLAIVVNASHGPRVRPEFAEERAAEERLVKALARFGLTPTARAAMRLPEGGDDPFAKLAAELAQIGAEQRGDVDAIDATDAGDAVDEAPAKPRAKKTATKKTPAAKKKSTAKARTSSSSAKKTSAKTTARRKT